LGVTRVAPSVSITLLDNLVIVIVAARDPCVSVSKCKRQCNNCRPTVSNRCLTRSECML